MTTAKVNPNGADYASAVLRLYLELPGTPRRVRLHDRRCAAELYRRAVSIATVESALLLASLRRLTRPPDAPRLSPVRSLAYFLPVVEELLENPMPDGYQDYLRTKMRLLTHSCSRSPANR